MKQSFFKYIYVLPRILSLEDAPSFSGETLSTIIKTILMEKYEKLKDPKYSTIIYSKASGNNRALNAINSVFEKVKNGGFDISKTINIFLQIASREDEITISEIGEISDVIQQRLPYNVNIVMGVIEKDIEKAIEVQLLFTELYIDSNHYEIDKVFNSQPSKIESLPIYFLADEYSSEELSSIISFLSDLYSSIGGDRLKIKGYQSIDIEKVFYEPAF